MWFPFSLFCNKVIYGESTVVVTVKFKNIVAVHYDNNKSSDCEFLG